MKGMNFLMSDNETSEKAVTKSATNRDKHELNFCGPVVYVEPSELVPFVREVPGKGKEEQLIEIRNPFNVPEDTNDEDMKELRRGIEEYGVLVPLTVRKREDGKYELLSGYRRKKAVESINKEREDKSIEPLKLPVVEVKCDDDQAIEILSTSNMHRSKVSLIEKIRSCGFVYRALRRKSRYSEQSEKAADVVGKMFHLEPKQVQRYSALLNLNENLLRFVCRENVIVEEKDKDTEKKIKKEICYRTTDGDLKLPRRSGEILSTLSKAQQGIIFEFLMGEDASIPVSKAAFVRRMFREKPDITSQELQSIAKGWREVAAESSSEIEEESKDEIQSYFTEKMPAQIRKSICVFLAKWKEAGSPENFSVTVTELSKSADAVSVDGGN